MSDTQRLLELLESCVVDHGGDLGGWTRQSDGQLQIFDGRVTLRVEIHDDETPSKIRTVHTHVFATLHEHGDEVLDACVMGMGDSHDSAFQQAAALWLTGVAGPIRSFLDNKPVCMTCQAGVANGDLAHGYSQSGFGFTPGLRAYVGPSFARGLDGPGTQDGTLPWFRFAAESAAPRRVHIAKSTVLSKGKDGWTRDLEIDGHDVSYHDTDWPAKNISQVGYLTRFAVFEFPPNSTEITRRAELERTIRHFAEHYSKCESVDALTKEMEKQGFDPELIHEVESISTIAFGRTLFENHGIDYAPTIIRARRNGRIETDVPLMSIPAFTRARAIAARLRETMPEEEFQALGLYTAESNAILQAMESFGDGFDFSQLGMGPSVVPDYGVKPETMDAAVAELHRMMEEKGIAKKKPWWKFW